MAPMDYESFMKSRGEKGPDKPRTSEPFKPIKNIPVLPAAKPAAIKPANSVSPQPPAKREKPDPANAENIQIPPAIKFKAPPRKKAVTKEPGGQKSPMITAAIIFAVIVIIIGAIHGFSKPEKKPEAKQLSSAEKSKMTGKVIPLFVDRSFTVFNKENETWDEMTRGEIPFGADILTGPLSNRNIFTANNIHTIRCKPNTRFLFESAEPVPGMKNKIIVKLDEGTIWVDCASDMFEVRTPLGNAIGDDSLFEVEINPNGSININCWSGKVVFSSKDENHEIIEIESKHLLLVDSSGILIPAPFDTKKTAWQVWNIESESEQLVSGNIADYEDLPDLETASIEDNAPVPEREETKTVKKRHLKSTPTSAFPERLEKIPEPPAATVGQPAVSKPALPALPAAEKDNKYPTYPKAGDKKPGQTKPERHDGTHPPQPENAPYEPPREEPVKTMKAHVEDENFKETNPQLNPPANAAGQPGPSQGGQSATGLTPVNPLYNQPTVNKLPDNQPTVEKLPGL